MKLFCSWSATKWCIKYIFCLKVFKDSQKPSEIIDTMLSYPYKLSDVMTVTTYEPHGGQSTIPYTHRHNIIVWQALTCYFPTLQRSIIISLNFFCHKDCLAKRQWNVHAHIRKWHSRYNMTRCTEMTISWRNAWLITNEATLHLTPVHTNTKASFFYLHYTHFTKAYKNLTGPVFNRI